MTSNTAGANRQGVVAVVVRDGTFLVVRRSAVVEAPGKLCFPGGGIEAGESELQALYREMREELGVIVHPLVRLWESRTSWNVQLGWWQCQLQEPIQFSPNHEVAEVTWMTPEVLLASHDLLESNREFLIQVNLSKLIASSEAN